MSVYLGRLDSQYQGVVGLPSQGHIEAVLKSSLVRKAAVGSIYLQLPLLKAGGCRLYPVSRTHVHPACVEFLPKLGRSDGFSHSVVCTGALFGTCSHAQYFRCLVPYFPILRNSQTIPCFYVWYLTAFGSNIKNACYMFDGDFTSWLAGADAFASTGLL